MSKQKQMAAVRAKKRLGAIAAGSLAVIMSFLPTFAFAAISFDTGAVGASNTNTSGTDSVTVAAANSAMCLMILGDTTTDYVTAVALGPYTLTQIDKNHPAGDRWNYLYYGSGIAPGTYTLTISKSSSSLSKAYYGVYSGVADTGGTPDAANSVKNHAASTDYTVSVSTVSDNDWVCGGYNDVGGSTDSNGAATVIRASTSGRGQADSNAAKTPPGSVALHVSSDTSLPYDFLALAMAPYVAPAPSSSTSVWDRIFGSATTTASTTLSIVDNPTQDLFFGLALGLGALWYVTWFFKKR